MANVSNINLNGMLLSLEGAESIYAELGISLDRFAELLCRDAYTPTLSAKPDSSVAQYTDGQDGSTNHYSVGQTVVYPDSGMADGLGMSVVKAVNSDGTIVWGDLFPKTNVYVGSTLYSCDTDGAVRLPAYPTVPTSLKCPYYLYIQGNGTSLGSYNGASSKTINITPSSIGAAEASHTHSGYLTSHQSIYSLTIQGNGTTIDTYTPNSASKTINITPAGIGAAAASHTHSYLPLVGGTLKGSLIIDGNDCNFIRNLKYTGYSTDRHLVRVTMENSSAVGKLGVFYYKDNGTTMTYRYMYLGNNAYNENNLRVWTDHVSYGNTNIAICSGTVQTNLNADKLDGKDSTEFQLVSDDVSDIRLKTDIMEYDALDIVMSNRSVAYKWNDVAKQKNKDFNDDAWHYGLIAQELQEQYPQLVGKVFDDEYICIHYSRLVPILWRAVQQICYKLRATSDE